MPSRLSLPAVVAAAAAAVGPRLIIRRITEAKAARSRHIIYVAVHVAVHVADVVGNPVR